MGEKKEKGIMNNKDGDKKVQTNTEVINKRHSLINGLPAVFLHILMLYGLIFICSMIFKSIIVDTLDTSGLSMEGGMYYVHPVTGLIAIMVLAVSKIIFDMLFYNNQRYMERHQMKLQRILAGLLYVSAILGYLILTFLLFLCGKDFFDTYNFKSELAENLGFTILFFVLPVSYIPVYLVERFVRKNIGKKDKV